MERTDQARWQALRQWGRRLLSLTAGCIIALIGGVLLLFCRPCGLSDALIGAIYKNVDPPIDHEMPVTVTSYPSSPTTVAVIGGRGEGLNCSIPWYAKLLFPAFQLHGKNSPVERRFHQACVFHDLCYRHGLATYGYSQADCDTLLQEHAVRICRYLEKTIAACQLDAKKVLAGVAFFGAEAYRNWDETTYFEFDPNPVRSEKFTAVRVVNHPFSASPSLADPRQWMLSFDIKRSGMSVACINCARRTFTDAELREARVQFDEKGVPIGLPSREARPEAAKAPVVLLPPRTSVSAPHLLNLPGGSNRLAWLNRQETHNTMLCLALADPKSLLTRTRYDSAGCHKEASTRIALTSADLFTATPQPIVHAAKGNVFVTGLSGQRANHVAKCWPTGASLRVYKTTDVSDGLEWKYALADCLFDKQGNSIGEFGMFQYPPIIKQNRHIFLSRSLVNSAGSQKSPDGVPGDLRVSVFDVNFEQAAMKNEAIFDHRLNIANTHDMMWPVTSEMDDYRVLSVTASPEHKPKKGDDVFRLIETDLRSRTLDTLAMRDVAERELPLHRSWIRRPVHVANAQSSDSTLRTELVLSRSRISQTVGNHGAVVFEFAVLGRNRSNEKVFTLQRGARCTIRYTSNLGGGHPACRRVNSIDFRSRQGLQTRLQGTQLLVGDFKTRSDTSKSNPAFDVALYDACASRQPIIFRANDESFDVVREGGPELPRLASCGTLDRGRMAADIEDIAPIPQTKSVLSR